MTRFCDFACSPYFNKHKDVKALVTLLSEAYPDFSEKKCGRSVLFKQLFPGKTHHQPSLAIVFSYSLRLFEQFLVAEELAAAGAFIDKTHYAKQLRKRNLTAFLRENELETEIKTTNKVSKSVSPTSTTLDGIQRSYRAAAERDAIGLKTGHPQLESLLEKQFHLDAFFALDKLRDACELQQRARLIKTELPGDVLLEALVKSFESAERLRKIPLIEAYLAIYSLLKTNDLAQFRACLDFIRENSGQIGKDDLQQLFNYLQNHCIEQINKGQQPFLWEVFRIYQFQLDNQLLLVNGELPEWHFKNIVTTGLRIDERDWVRNFMESYKNQLPAGVAENAHRYNLAMYFYHIGQPKQVLPLLVQVEYTDLRYNLDAKSLLLRTYFDLGEDEALMAHCEAFKQFVKRNKSLTEFQKQGYFNLIRFAIKIYRLWLNEGLVKQDKWQQSALQLKADLGAAETVFNKPWLEGKLEEMIGNI
ncbi:MAG: hypothetical protein IPN76_29655 [Saprospiraceae bacterium]|nr:hypothetical protein [Saprospiraceae bacterium]